MRRQIRLADVRPDCRVRHLPLVVGIAAQHSRRQLANQPFCTSKTPEPLVNCQIKNLEMPLLVIVTVGSQFVNQITDDVVFLAVEGGGDFAPHRVHAENRTKIGFKPRIRKRFVFDVENSRDVGFVDPANTELGGAEFCGSGGDGVGGVGGCVRRVRRLAFGFLASGKGRRPPSVVSAASLAAPAPTTFIPP